MAPRQDRSHFPRIRNVKKDYGQNRKKATLNRPLAASKVVAQRKNEGNQIKKQVKIVSTSKVKVKWMWSGVEVNNRIYKLHSSVYSCPLRSVGDPHIHCDFLITEELYNEQLSWKQFSVNGRDGVAAAAKHLLDVHKITIQNMMSDILQYPHSKYTFITRRVGRREYLRIKLGELEISGEKSRELENYFDRMYSIEKIVKKKTNEDVMDVSESMEKFIL